MVPEPLTLYAQLTNKAPRAGWFGNKLAAFPGNVLWIMAIGKTLSHDGLAAAGTAAPVV